MIREGLGAYRLKVVEVFLSVWVPGVVNLAQCMRHSAGCVQNKPDNLWHHVWAKKQEGAAEKGRRISYRCCWGPGYFQHRWIALERLATPGCCFLVAPVCRSKSRGSRCLIRRISWALA